MTMVAELSTPQPARHPAPTVKATELAYLVFARPDLDRAAAFLTDFGLLPVARTQDVLYMRGRSETPACYRVHRRPKPAFVGAGFRVGSRKDLERVAKLPGASAIERSEHPGGGELVRLRDPAGFVVEVVHGQAPAPTIPTRAPIAIDDPRRFNAPQRPPVEPADVLRLGHFVLEVADYQATCAFYTEHLGLIPSDVQVLPDGSPAVTFFRLDLGDTPADHHSLAIAQGFMPAFSHAAFEVLDADAVGMGQRVLRERGWKHAWGIGRHILGSQIFDYWSDPWGAKHEHYCDGDRFTADEPMGVHPVSREAMSQWGPPMPRSFTRPRLTPAAVSAIVANLRRSPDLTLEKLLQLARMFA
jgi:catechol 2,3-dioxygenase-like lactoylglutathione lyase family enzyme